MLWFGGAYMDTTVFVNGTEVGQWKYGYTSFWFDITDALHEARTRFLSAAICATPTPAGTPVRACTAMWNCGSSRPPLKPDGLYVAAKEATTALGPWPSLRGRFRHRRQHGPHADAASDR